MVAILLVFDGVGIGAMEDVATSRHKDINANTLLHTAEVSHPLLLPTMQALGLGNLVRLPAVPPMDHPQASFGMCDLGYPGADSYMGHQSIMGTLPQEPVRSLMREIHSHLASSLKFAGYKVTYPYSQYPILLVDDRIVIGDNLEADAGQIINLTVPTRLIDFDQAVLIGNIVRGLVETSRVIVFGGPGISLNDIFHNIEILPSGQIGINSPNLGVYDENFVVRHLGYGVNPKKQLAWTYSESKRPVSLFGKMADLIECPNAKRNAMVDSARVMDLVTESYASAGNGLIAATIQETDLAGHEKDPQRLASILKLVDKKLGFLLETMHSEDLLIITADHGNDPTLLGTHQHTRERVPLIWYQKGRKGRSIGLRSSLADISSSIARWAELPWSGDGIPFI